MTMARQKIEVEVQQKGAATAPSQKHHLLMLLETRQYYSEKALPFGFVLRKGRMRIAALNTDTPEISELDLTRSG